MVQSRNAKTLVLASMLALSIAVSGCATMVDGAVGAFGFPMSCGPEAYKAATDEHASGGDRALNWAGLVFSPVIGAAHGVWHGLQTDIRFFTGQTKESMMYDDVDKANLKKAVHPCGGTNPHSDHHKHNR